MESSDRFVEMVTSVDDVRLDVGALCIAAHAHPGLVVDEWIARIDEIAGTCTDVSLDAVVAELFGRRGFHGDLEHYDDPENSFLDSVVERRCGIPISLSVLVIEVARRLGISVLPVGLPGHFLVRAAECPDHWCDPFHGGRLLTREQCHALFDTVYRGTRSFEETDLLPVSARSVLARMLANLESGELARDPVQLAWMCELHLAIPGVSVADGVQLLRRLARVVDPVRAARAYERMAEGFDDEVAKRLRSEARLLRSRMN